MTKKFSRKWLRSTLLAIRRRSLSIQLIYLMYTKKPGALFLGKYLSRPRPRIFTRQYRSTLCSTLLGLIKAEVWKTMNALCMSSLSPALLSWFSVVIFSLDNWKSMPLRVVINIIKNYWFKYERKPQLKQIEKLLDSQKMPFPMVNGFLPLEKK